MRSVVEIQEEIEQIAEELEQAEYGSYEYDELDCDLFMLESELSKALKKVDRIQQTDLYHHRDLQNKGLVE
jgi:hypothetical protein